MSPLLAVLFFWVIYLGVVDGKNKRNTRKFWEECEEMYE